MSREEVSTVLPIQGAIQSPGGEIQYFTTTIKNKHNPYLHQSALDEENGTEYTEIECNGERILIPTSAVQSAITLEWNASIVRFLCLLDFIINIFITFSTDYSILYTLTISIISLSGYFATRSYSRSGLICYLIYQYIQSFGKLTLTVIYIAATSSQQIYNGMRKSNTILLKPSIENIIMLIISTFGQIYITYFIQNFYNMLPRRQQIQHSTAVLTRV